MIILDLSQIIYSVILTNKKEKELNENLYRHIILNCIKKINKKFKKEYGELVIAFDGAGGSWRRKSFPFYKQSRRKEKEKNKEEWKEIFNFIKKIKTEFDNHLPYRFVEIEHAEGDDVIAALTINRINRTEPVLIVSSDKDFIQLHNKDVKQYDPIKGRFIKHETNSKDFLIEHIIKGDRIDGIPNIFSDDDCLINIEKRQVSLTTERFNNAKEYILNELNGIQNNPEYFTKNYIRNRELIDFSKIPNELTEAIKINFLSQTRNRTNMRFYFLDNKLNDLLYNIGDF